jgi:hypothetical protein
LDDLEDFVGFGEVFAQGFCLGLVFTGGDLLKEGLPLFEEDFLVLVPEVEMVEKEIEVPAVGIQKPEDDEDVDSDDN